MFGNGSDERKEMLESYKTIAILSAQAGNQASSSLYFEKAMKIMEKEKADPNLTEERKKAVTEDLSKLYF